MNRELERRNALSAPILWGSYFFRTMRSYDVENNRNIENLRTVGGRAGKHRSDMFHSVNPLSDILLADS